MVDLREGGFLISKIQKLSSRIFAKLLRDFNTIEINPAQGRVMFPLWLQENLPFQDLLEKTSLSKATLSHMLDNLEESGHIKRVRSEEDKRTLNIKLTKKNKALQEKYFEVSDKMNKLFYNGFTEKEIDQFENHLRRLLNNLTSSGTKDKT
ncbi:MAG: MarR family winged helix-turn-helix transcriptional regulator [Promethearchaeota archaeon]|jgi:DNA-binding MarR family transcriptional regulator